MANVYSKQFKLGVLRQMVGPDAKSAVQLAAETGVCHSTISRWLMTANGVEVMSNKRRDKKSPALKSKAVEKRIEDWTAQEKLHVVMEAAGLADEELGEFLRERGLHEVHLQAWRDTVLDSLNQRPRRGEKTKIRNLERELRRKEKALAETAALLVLQKKVNAIWGTSEDEDDDTPPSSGES